MTEITAKYDGIFWRAARPGPRYLIDPVAFFIALFGAPLLVALLGFWAFFIPIFALVFGGPIYLLLATPALLIHLRFRKGDTNGIITLAFAVVIGSAIAGCAYGLLVPNSDLAAIALFYGFFGLILGPLWGWAFGWIYNRLRSDFSRVPH
ncbi:hypothetical protein [Pseudosulfitobacter pseudonitzschiae]|uniref:hypothetical protein n=1 Tax=Pseudosulfitobacter pseudonitzschiae TaxID=1402135 RepID=UPI001AF5964C|nr:hypothetical protein [Pseudosulfitobacter pseudonitzschiae]MBM1814210.1 hypothetical protein [Pseudosulfitobacter pseudonitzschiae]MBM1831203.1 hypothetical protein [Pseudosulfitobacter pseudonitzschiae]MBM1836070.1 hypothetical protein [Pseudosulfitobacter pseudonitzschiae]MBM1840916.1 hypothetical protein [Pseudosulfitobacter pseudonitzschiae]MBM1845096.1 hypothetical protein [Pseudosulfitobacter pseudonitzschiae]